MTRSQLDRLLETAVADALGVRPLDEVDAPHRATRPRLVVSVHKTHAAGELQHA